jgi:hypothetical protein
MECARPLPTPDAEQIMADKAARAHAAAMKAAYANAGVTLAGAVKPLEERKKDSSELPQVACGGSYL